MSSLDTIAITIDREGFDALDLAAIDTVLDLAAGTGASAVLAEVFADVAEPAPVRERAFGLLAMQITSATRRAPHSRSRTSRQPHRRLADSVDATPCEKSKRSVQRSRVAAPPSAGELRSSWLVRLPSLR